MDSSSSGEDSGSEWEPSGSDSESDCSDVASDFDEAWDWFRINCSDPPVVPERYPFSEVPGLKFLVDNPNDPLQYFLQLFDGEVTEHIICKTNENARRFLSSCNLSAGSRASKWLDIGRQELLCFVSLLILQGINMKGSSKAYWSRVSVLETPFFGKVMSERKFGLIMKFLGCFNEECLTGKSELHRLNSDPFFRLLMQKFSRSYVTEREISVDEALVFNYRLRKKVIGCCRSPKLYYLCESSSGYVCDLLIYGGLKTAFDPLFSKCKKPTKIVMTLMRDRLDKGHCLTLDSFFTSPELAGILDAHGTDTYGVLKPTRKGLPWELRAERLEKGHMMAFRKGKMTIVKWQEKTRSIVMLTTVHSTLICKEEKEDKYVKRPVAVVDYDRNLKRFSLMDQCLMSHLIRNDGRKVYKRLFHYLVDMTVWNAYVLYSKCGGALDVFNFKVKLVERLVEEFGSFGSGPCPGYRTQSPLRYSGIGHFPAVYPRTSQKLHPTKRCVLCSATKNELGKSIRRESRFFCKVCNVGLCVVPCFEIYHTRQ